MNKFIFDYQGYKKKECDVEVYKNETGLIVKFFELHTEPKVGRICDYVFVPSGYGYINVKLKKDDAIMSGFLKKDFFSNSSIIYQAIDEISKMALDLFPQLEESFIPYNLERIEIYDALIATGETFDDLKEEEKKQVTSDDHSIG